MITAFGKYLRELRSDSGEYLMDMANRLGVSTALLYNIESGKRSIQDDFLDKLCQEYSLTDEQQELLALSVARTNKAAVIPLDGLNQSDELLAFALAQNFSHLPETTKTLLRESLQQQVRVLHTPEYQEVVLLNGKTKNIPADAIVLNPESCDTSSVIYAVWFFDADAPCDQISAWNGNSLGPLYCYASKRNDIYKLGKPRPSFNSEEDRMECMTEFLALSGAMLKASRNIFSDHPECKCVRFSWMNIDEIFETTSHIGTSSIIERPR